MASSGFVRSHGVPLRLRVKYAGRRISSTIKSLPEQIYFSVRECPDPSSTILLAGSGRSGTTWFADVLTRQSGIQQVFEPLHPYWISEVRELTGWPKDLYQMRGWYLRRGEENPAWEEFLGRVMSGKVRAWGWTDHHRTSYFPERYLIKLIRANLMLGHIYDTFQPSVVHIMRHPCAVILSQLSSRWEADVRDLIRQEELVEDHLRPWIGKLEKIQTRLDAFAAWWAVENMVAKKELAAFHQHSVYYEDVITRPRHEIARAFAFLGMPGPENGTSVLEEPSRTLSKATYASSDERLSRWKEKLSSEDQTRIMGWMELFGIEDYDMGTMPRRSPRSSDG